MAELKKLVSLVDRTEFDYFAFPADCEQTEFYTTPKPYHNYTKEVATWSFAGSPNWGQRVVFTVPNPWEGDILNWIAVRLKPMSWLPAEAQRRIGPDAADWLPIDPANFWIWANSLGTAAIERVEMEVDGVILESFSGDWLDVWSKTNQTISRGTGFDDGIFNNRAQPTIQQFQASEDGYVYCYLPFWFSKYTNTGFPLLSCRGPVRFNITFRSFPDVVRKLTAPKECKESPIRSSFQVNDCTYPFRKLVNVTSNTSIPAFETADIICGISHLDGDLRAAYLDPERPHELLMNPVVETTFAEPLKYVQGVPTGDSIRIALPLPEANGPIRQILFFLRLKSAVENYNDYTNYSGSLNPDPIWNPIKPLLERAQLFVGTSLWADEDEAWWRYKSNLHLPGGIRAAGNFIYGYNFADKPTMFDPTGSINASRADIRLNLTVSQPSMISNEFTVSVFLVGTNWIRFEKSLANILFMD